MPVGQQAARPCPCRGPNLCESGEGVRQASRSTIEYEPTDFVAQLLVVKAVLQAAPGGFFESFDELAGALRPDVIGIFAFTVGMVDDEAETWARVVDQGSGSAALRS